MPLSSISRATAWSLIPYLTCRHKSFLSQLPIRSRHRFQKGLGQPWLKAPSCSHPPCGPPAAPGQYSLKQKSPPQLVPGSATVAAQAGSEQPLPQWWDSGLLHTAWVLLVGFTADSCSGAGGCMGLCQQDTGALFCFVFPKWHHRSCQAKRSSSGAHLPAAAAMTNGGDSSHPQPL